MVNTFSLILDFLLLNFRAERIISVISIYCSFLQSNFSDFRALEKCCLIYIVTEQIFISDDTIMIRHGFCAENRLLEETSKIIRR
jgi:hypothetical protein